MSQRLRTARREDRPRGAPHHTPDTDTREEPQAARRPRKDRALLLTASGTLGLGARGLQSAPPRQTRGHGPACLPRPGLHGLSVQCRKAAHTQPARVLGFGCSGQLLCACAPHVQHVLTKLTAPETSSSAPLHTSHAPTAPAGGLPRVCVCRQQACLLPGMRPEGSPGLLLAPLPLVPEPRSVYWCSRHLSNLVLNI